jgi:hypothetical protein
MSHDLCQVEEPYLLLVKEYDEKPDPKDLAEVFAIIYAYEVPQWKIKEETDGIEYVFFTSFDKAYKRYKYEGPRRSLMKRIFTDNEELIELAKKNDAIEGVEEVEESDKLEDIKTPEDKLEESEPEPRINKITYDV